ncbi:ribonuclease T2 family protein [Sphingomonas immobilis]|uniref:Ribonuclease T n=1 Tax=Sphingomonas immobilis TaxID=3063997 RepID=A0ABT8ZU05_9SPHN|nr:ribonuclease T [Sphingomonas sp. CA1-15]MDO7841051.1 ribonuclease T [Sphingomonas sp. CA1-15]
MLRSATAAFLALTAAGTAHAQALQCVIPNSVPRPHPDLPSASEPARNLPIGSYTLALTWAPEYCVAHKRDKAASMECGGGNRFGFTLHGLWPDGMGAEWPQYCAATPILPAALIKQHLCSTPSAQLIQHEWSKHGTCMQTTPAAYFAKSTGLYAKLRYPDMDALSRRPLNAGQFAAAFARANPGLPAEAIRVTVNKRGWLDELWLCLDKSFAYERCKPNSGGAAANATLKIWRGRR